MNPTTGQPKRTPEETQFRAEMNEIAAVVYDLLISHKISGSHREVAADHLTQARLLVKSGRIAEARESLARLADIVAGWRVGVSSRYACFASADIPQS
jgi:hypothetical protein